MRIAIIASIWISVPPKNMGFGAQEYLAYHLAEALIERGHEVVLFASGDSQTSATLKSITPSQIKDHPSKDTKTKDYFELMNLSEAYKNGREFDIIHNHLLPYGLLFPPLIDTPTVHTLHHKIYTSREDRSEIALYKRFKDQQFVSISHAQQKIVPELNYIGTVYNGVNEKEFTFKESPEGDYLLVLGRLRKYKGIHTAIQVARETNRPLKIAGPLPTPNDPEYTEIMSYWKKEIEPLLTDTITYVGPVEGTEKIALMQHAKALLFAPDEERQEPFGMTLIEAMSCGTPVIAYNGGAVPEILKDGETGFLISYPSQDTAERVIKETGEAGLKKAVETVYLLPKEKEQAMRQSARSHIEKSFTITRMVDSYEKLYKEVTS